MSDQDEGVVRELYEELEQLETEHAGLIQKIDEAWINSAPIDDIRRMDAERTAAEEKIADLGRRLKGRPKPEPLLTEEEQRVRRDRELVGMYRQASLDGTLHELDQVIVQGLCDAVGREGERRLAAGHPRPQFPVE